jgi:hypothetical protein
MGVPVELFGSTRGVDVGDGLAIIGVTVGAGVAIGGDTVGVMVSAGVAVGGTSVGGTFVGIVVGGTVIDSEETIVAVGETEVAPGPHALTRMIRVKRTTVLTAGLNIDSCLCWLSGHAP